MVGTYQVLLWDVVTRQTVGTLRLGSGGIHDFLWGRTSHVVFSL